MTHRRLWMDVAAGAYDHGCDGRGGGWAGLRQVLHIRTTREALAPDLPVLAEDHYYSVTVEMMYRP